MRITNRHETAIELLLDGDLSKKEIAAAVQISRKTLYNWLKDKDFADELEERQTDHRRMVRAKLERLADRAVKAQEKIITKGKDEKAIATVSSDVLDRAGYLKPKSNENKTAPEGTGVIILAEVKDDGEKEI